MAATVPMADHLLLQAENQRLRDRIAELEELLSLDIGMPPGFQCEARKAGWQWFCLLANRPRLTREAMMAVAYSHLDFEDRPDIKIVDVTICKLRKWLKPHGIKIRTDWGVGYSLTPEMRTRAKALIASLTQVQEAAE